MREQLLDTPEVLVTARLARGQAQAELGERFADRRGLHVARPAEQHGDPRERRSRRVDDEGAGDAANDTAKRGISLDLAIEDTSAVEWSASGLTVKSRL